MKSNLHHASGSTARTSFRSILQSELAKRCAANPQYSLRALAKYLGVDHSTLSQLLRRKRRFSSQAIQKFGTRLGLDQAAIDTFTNQEKHEPRPEDEGSTVQEVRQLTRDVAHLIADWHHYAILELLRVREFRPDSRWIARVLGITVDEVNVALQCLIRLGLLEMVSPREWVDHLGDAMTSIQGFTQASIEHYLEQVRKLTLRSLQSTPQDRYAFSTSTVALGAARLPGAMEIIARFREELLAFVGQGADRDDVYQLHVSFVPVTRLQQGE